MSTVYGLTLSPASLRVTPTGGIISQKRNRRCKRAVFPLVTPPPLPPPPRNRKHTYLCRGHLPLQACPLCGCLYKPGILLPCSPGRADTAVDSQTTGRCLNRMTYRLVSDRGKYITYFLCRYRQPKSLNTSGLGFVMISFHCSMQFLIESFLSISLLACVIFKHCCYSKNKRIGVLFS